jgi:protein-tyrosine phosphatase
VVSKPGVNVLFVCLGNICRSPLAEAVFRHLVRERGLEERFGIDSAGTSGWHVGAAPDARSAAAARGRGIELTGSSRKLTAADLERFDYIVAMDAENMDGIMALARKAGGARARVHRLREWDPEPDDLDVPDPYYGGDSGFDRVQDIVERSCAALLDHIVAEHGLA